MRSFRHIEPRTAPVVYAGDPEWRSITVGMPIELHDWVARVAKAQNLTKASIVRAMLIEAYTGRQIP